MSTLIVEVCQIEKIVSHPNADRLEIAFVKGWQCIVGKNEFCAKEKIIFIPPDSILPIDFAEKWGIRKYLAGKNKDRVKCARLRNEMSFGIIIPCEKSEWEIGKDVKEYYRIVKYEPPLRSVPGDAAPEDSLFPRMTDIENMRNFPTIFKEGELVAVTEKIDGTQSIIGSSPVVKENGEFPENEEVVIKASSRKHIRKKPEEDKIKSTTYWYPWTLKPVQDFIYYFIKKEHKQIQLFGEIYGSVRGGHKSMHYGVPKTLNYAAFRLKLDGKFVSYKEFKGFCDIFNVSIVPLITVMSFNFKKIEKLSRGFSLLAKKNGVEHLREGVVVVSFDKENGDILKFHNDDI